MKLEGRIVEYLENGKFICGFVYEETGSRVRLLNQHSRELNLPLNRIIHATGEKREGSLSKEEIIAILKSAHDRRETLAEQINLDETWELVSEKPEDTYQPDFLAALFFGDSPGDDQVAAFLRAVIGNRLYFKYKSGEIHVHSPEKVEQITLMLAREKEQNDFITENSMILRRIWEEEQVPHAWSARETTLGILRDMYLFGKDAEEYDLARKLVKEARLNGPHDIFHLLVKAGLWDRNENIPLLRQELPTTFSEEGLAEAEAISLPPAEELLTAGRKDLRELKILTIDGPETRDFDDGLHVEKQGDSYLVGIHISDVGLFIKPGTALFEETLQRGTSIYFPEKPRPMLPAGLSEGTLSLIRGQDRPAVSFLVLLSPAAEVIRFELVHSIISVKRQLTYTEADRLISSDKTLATLAALSKLLRQRRVNNGALLLPVPELHIRITPDDTVEISKNEVDTPSRILIAEFMILANTLGAQFVADREAPGLFRCQMEPRQRIIDGFEEDITKVIQQRKRLSPGSLLTSPKQHSGVGAPQYTTVTSPIRRLLDLIMQLQISNLIRGRGILFNSKDMKHYAGIILSTLDKANQVRHLRQRYWILKHLETKAGSRIPATVIDRGPRRIHLFLQEYLIDVDLPVNSAFKVAPGDTVLIKLSKVDPLSNILKVEW